MKGPLTKIISRVMPAVVSIAVSKTLAEVEREIPKELLPFLPFENSHLKVPEEYLDSTGLIKVGGGSGFIVRDDGIVLTNKHVVSESSAEYSVVTNDNRTLKTKILAVDPVDDIAILKIDLPSKEKLPTVQLGDSLKIDLGEEVLAFGNALGMFKNTVSRGIVSGLARTIHASPEPEKPEEEFRGLIQTDAAINPGNSGGPLVNIRGEVIGINTAVVSGAQSLGFAIPINVAVRDLKDLKKQGRIVRPLLGLRYMTVGPELKIKMNLPVDYGALVIGRLPEKPAVTLGGPADKAGVRARDIILTCDGKKINEDYTIQDVLSEKRAGQTLKMNVLRDKVDIDFEVLLTERK
jgi:serine protease Do